VARRHEALSEEIAELDVQLDRLVAEAAPELLALPAVGTDHAATLLIVAGDDPASVEERGFVCQPLWSVARRSLLRQGGETSPQP
jgi:hypothetical protein